WLNVGSISGTGTIDAGGGDGKQGSYAAAGGGGGRIALYYGDATGFDLEAQVLARGGAGYSTYVPWGGAGTIYLKQATAPTGQLRVDNGAAPVGNVAITELSGTFEEPFFSNDADISVQPGSVFNGSVDFSGTNIEVADSTFSSSVDFSGANIEATGSTFSGQVNLSASHIDVTGSGFSGSVQITDSQIEGSGAAFIGSLYLSGTQINATGMDINLVDNFEMTVVSELTTSQAVDASSEKLVIQTRLMTVDGTSSLDVTGKGLDYQGTGSYTGGSYGGRGGEYNGGTSIATYGDYREPTHFGTGGSSGPLGGGSLKLVVTEELVLDGGIVSQGASGTSNSDGGGSGGSLWLNVGSISGTGTIDAGGGDG
ncbi:MAG: hypothetical protein GY934_00895, partial [Gammaproteobacteria bacterium]|nr:hypothetical protein [Gammaproteobacteria bacterium]